MKSESLIDLPADQLNLLKRILEQKIPNKTVWTYGSRVKWKANAASDIDLAVFDCTPSQIEDLREAFEESDLLMSVDVMDWETIPDNFKQNIKKNYIVLQEPSIPKGWKTVRLGEIAELSKSIWRPGDSSMPYIGLEHIKEGSLTLNSVGSSESVVSNKFQFQSGDTLFGKLRPYFRKVVKPNFDGICSSDIWVVRPKENIDKNFLFYFFASQRLVDIASSSASGTRMPRADWNFLSETVWAVPSEPEQKAIAEVLGSLDDKIDLLHRQNKTLENIAQTLFQKWFIDSPESISWGHEPLSYFGDIICGKTPSKKVTEYFGREIPFIKIPDMHGKHFIFDTEDGLTEAGKESQDSKSIPPRSICVSCIATVGVVSMNAFISQTNQQINTVVPSKDEYRYFIYLFMKLSKDLLRAMASGGTATMNLNTRSFSEILLPLPDNRSLLGFDREVNPLFEKIFLNGFHIRTLRSIRDTLIPKLVNGKVSVRR